MLTSGTLWNSQPFPASGAPAEGLFLSINANEVRRTRKRFFMVASFVNPHDIMFGNGNIPGEPEVQKPVVPWVTREFDL